MREGCVSVVRLTFGASAAARSAVGCRPWLGGMSSGSFFRLFVAPFEAKSFCAAGTVPEVKIDQSLIRYLRTFSERFEIVDCLLVETNRNLLLESLRIRIRARFREVVALSHGFHRLV